MKRNNITIFINKIDGKKKGEINKYIKQKIKFKS